MGSASGSTVRAACGAARARLFVPTFLFLPFCSAKKNVRAPKTTICGGNPSLLGNTLPPQKNKTLDAYLRNVGIEMKTYAVDGRRAAPRARDEFEDVVRAVLVAYVRRCGGPKSDRE